MDSINLCYEMCDYIEQNGVVKLVGNVKLRDNLKKELLHFLISVIDMYIRKSCYIFLYTYQ